MKNMLYFTKTLELCSPVDWDLSGFINPLHAVRYRNEAVGQLNLTLYVFLLYVL